MHLSVSVQIATQKGMLRYSCGGYVHECTRGTGCREWWQDHLTGNPSGQTL